MERPGKSKHQSVVGVKPRADEGLDGSENLRWDGSDMENVESVDMS